ncbi:TonB-dependent receptor domain-containing protein [Flavobacterium capsici]|uniref:TonB-dependent receptor n=1 Tax=Flavobacterium capsici TaxID=3075618 RepID=A0AA96ETR3_9FLAO|nr:MULTISPECIES: TonB-dependent receptor [unclassified Flavobacterium]WNM18288.1 TonB-dependent receptor [Flavobacterium sp. PMR2A8]WNM22339.1 TonB-dependent receptor [Flavobacterium sp. PMTSA4]
MIPNKKVFLAIFLLFTTFISFAQDEANNKVKVTGKVIDKSSSFPLEYSTITLKSVNNPNKVFGGITNNEGAFSIDVDKGKYNIVIEFISFQPTEIKNKEVLDNLDLGTIALDEVSKLLNEVIIRNESTTVEIKLDKKVYNVGKDLMVKGGTVSDVLDNIPSVTVDVDGTIALRGNDNVRVLIDGKPSTAINVSEALRLIPADAIDRVEVITNPSARYDAEGGGGLLNIILKKGKTNGLNGTIIATTGEPANHGLTGTLNYKTDNFNLFTTQGYNYRKNPGFSNVDTEYLNPTGNSPSYVYERRNNDRLNKGYNGGFGVEWFLDDNTNWTNSMNYRKNSSTNESDVVYTNIYNSLPNSIRNRFNSDSGNGEDVEFNSNLIKKFKKDGHQLTINFQTSLNKDDNSSIIVDSQFPNANTFSIQSQNKNLFSGDYVLPIGKGMQFEAGYRGEFTTQNTNVGILEDNVQNDDLSSKLEYKEKVNALYTQFGSKINKFSFLLGLRWEDSNIDVNLLDTNDFNNKKYNNFFPSAFFTYEISDQSSASISYSRRIRRPRGRFLNPSSDFSSNINLFQGNPDLDPAMTDSFDLGYLTKFGKKLTFNTSAYVNKTTDVFTFVRRNSGETTDDGIPIVLFNPINLATEYRAGFEFTLNYNPYKWWRLNSNFNFFSIETQGENVYIDFNGDTVVQNLNNKTTTWSTRLNSKINLPYSIDWQTNLSYEGDQKTGQGNRKGMFSANLAFSKDVFKDKATIALNVSDVFNSRIRRIETNLENLNSLSEFQWRKRQITLSFTYRFNKKKNDKEKKGNQQQDFDGGGDFPG